MKKLSASDFSYERKSAFSLDQGYLIRSLLDCSIEKLYCTLIADIYENSYFEVICGNELSKEFLLTIGTKTGDPLSAIVFTVTLDVSLKDVHKKPLSVLISKMNDVYHCYRVEVMPTT